MLTAMDPIARCDLGASLTDYENTKTALRLYSDIGNSFTDVADS